MLNRVHCILSLSYIISSLYIAASLLGCLLVCDIYSLWQTFFIFSAISPNGFFFILYNFISAFIIRPPFKLMLPRKYAGSYVILS